MKINITATIDIDKLITKIKSIQNSIFCINNQFIHIKKITYLIMTQKTLNALAQSDHSSFKYYPHMAGYFEDIPIAINNNCGLDFGEVDVCYEI